MFTTIVNYFEDLFENRSDPRVANFFLMQTPAYMIYSCIVYLLVVMVIGPKLMENRKPLVLKKSMMIYNMVQVVINGYIFIECILAGWMTKYSVFQCQPVDYTENPVSERELRITYLYFLAKFPEFVDTIFFVLRKKNSQVTFLHVYHHVTMPICSWAVCKFYPGGSTTILPFLNCAIHVMMYTYYMLAGLGPHMQPYLWWKKYLTGLQLIQFLAGTIHYVILLFSGADCNISKIFIILNIAQGTLFYLLFSSFYKKQYKQPEINGSSVSNSTTINEEHQNEKETNGLTNSSSTNNNNRIKSS